jgi:hypothetical protein
MSARSHSDVVRHCKRGHSFAADVVIRLFQKQAVYGAPELGGPPNVSVSVLPFGTARQRSCTRRAGLLVPGTSFFIKLRNNLVASASSSLFSRMIVMPMLDVEALACHRREKPG